MGDNRLRRIIAKKRDGKEWECDEIGYIVEAAKTLAVLDAKTSADRCQIGALLMAAYLNGLSDTETNLLTLMMRDSGRVFNWPDHLRGRIVDKHSTGGVGDKISLVLVPALAACNLLVPMISGRSLGHTGGTLDKLEAVDRCSVNLSDEKIVRAINNVGCCIAGQTEECVPADKVLYECRDLTSTVDYPPLIIASIVSKKLSENPSALVYDVKFGKGSFLKSVEDALETAKGLVKASSPVKAVALLTSMEFPIGRAIGDSLEMMETVECLKGGGPRDVIQLVEVLGNELKRLTGTEESVTEPLRDGKALEKFREMLLLQCACEEAVHSLCDGDASHAFRPSKPVHVTRIQYSGQAGYVSSIDPLVLGRVWKEEYSNSQRNPRVGFLLEKTVGDAIKSGDVWLQFHHQREELIDELRQTLSDAIQVSGQVSERKLVAKRVLMKDGCIVVEDY